MATATAVEIVKSRCAGISNGLAVSELTMAARAFFAETEIWTKELTLDTVADQADYDLDDELDELGEARRVLSVSLDDDDVDPSYYTFLDGTLTFAESNVPSDVYEMVVEVVVVPVSHNDQVSGDPYDSYVAKSLRHTDAIVAGALYSLFSMDGRPWSSAQNAETERRKYAAEVARVRRGKITNGTGMRITTPFRRIC